jgi:hypothetical protein
MKKFLSLLLVFTLLLTCVACGKTDSTDSTTTSTTVEDSSIDSNENESEEEEKTTKKPSKALGVIYRILALPLIVLGLLLALAINAVGWAFVAFGLLLWITGGRAIKKSK